MRRKVAMLLTAAMIASLATGCGGNSASTSSDSDSAQSTSEDTSDGADQAAAEKEEVNLTLVYPVGGTYAGQDAVNEKIAELAKRDLNVNLTVKAMSLTDCVNNISLMIAGGEDIDVFPTWANQQATFVSSGYVLDLTPYLDEEHMPNTLEWVGLEDVLCDNIDGYVWGVTTMRERCNPQGITVRADILDELGINVDDIETFDDITEVFAKVKENYPDMVIINGAGAQEGFGNAGDMAYQCDPLNDELGVLDNYGEELTVVNEFETESWVSLVKQAREWYEAGYISKDMPTSTDSGQTIFTAGNLFGYTDNWKPNTAVEKKSQTGYDAAVIPLSEPIRTTTSTSGLGYAVSGVTEHPDRAVELLDWLFGCGEVNDLMNFGVEGEDWVAVDDAIAAYPEGKDLNSVSYHLDWGWALPNQFAGHLWEGNDEDLYQQYEDFKNNAHVSKAYGFCFDSTNVTDQVIACQAVLSEYLPMLATGSVDPDVYIQEMNDKLYQAGLQEVMDEKQAQLDAWAKEQGIE